MLYNIIFIISKAKSHNFNINKSEFYDSLFYTKQNNDYAYFKNNFSPKLNIILIENDYYECLKNKKNIFILNSKDKKKIINLKANSNEIIFSIEKKDKIIFFNTTEKSIIDKNNNLICINITFLEEINLSKDKNKEKYFTIGINKPLFFKFNNLEENDMYLKNFDEIYFEDYTNVKIMNNNCEDVNNIIYNNKINKNITIFSEDIKQEKNNSKIVKISKIMSYICFGTIAIVLIYSRCLNPDIHYNFWKKFFGIYCRRKSKIWKYNMKWRILKE